MALATTAKFEELILEVEFDSKNAAGTYSAICGLIDVTISRSANVDSVEIPHCDDESLPLATERSVRSIDITVSGSGVWALESHEKVMDWFYSSQALKIRIRNKKVETAGKTGDTTIEEGMALFTRLDNQRTKGQKVTAEIELQFDGTPTRTAKS